MFKLNEVSKRDTNSFIKLSKTEYKTDNPVTQKNYFIWKYLDYFIKPTFIYQYLNAGKKVGRVMLQTNKLIIGKKIINTINPLDLLIQKKSRTNINIFIKLITLPSNRFNKNLIIHTSNENSDLLYKKLLKFKKRLSLEAYMFPANPFFFLKDKYLSNIFFKCISYFFLIIITSVINALKKLTFVDLEIGFLTTKEIYKVYKNLKDKKIPYFIRNDKFFQWRYSRYPKKKIYSFKLKLNNYVIASTTLCIVRFKGYKICAVMDYIAEDKISLIYRFFNYICIMKYALMHNCSFIFTLSNKRTKLFKAMLGTMIKIPLWMLPHQTPIYVRNYEDLDLTEMHFVLSDLDYF